MWFIPCQFPSLLLSLFQYKIHVFHHGHIQIIKRSYTPFRDSTLFLKHVSSLCGKGRMFVDIHGLGEPALDQ